QLRNLAPPAVKEPAVRDLAPPPANESLLSLEPAAPVPTTPGPQLPTAEVGQPPTPRRDATWQAIDALPPALWEGVAQPESLVPPPGSASSAELPSPATSGVATDERTDGQANASNRYQGPVEELRPPSAEAFGLPRAALPAPAVPAPAVPARDSLVPPAASAAPQAAKQAAAPEKGSGPKFYQPVGQGPGPRIDALTRQVPYQGRAFLPQPDSGLPNDAIAEASPYRGKSAVPVQRPWVELWRPLYTSGIYPPGKEWFGRYNLLMPHFLVYGDLRTGVGAHRNAQGEANSWATRLNLDMDLELTATERVHAFMGPLDRTGDFTRLDFTDEVRFVDRTDMRLDTLFFEGDAGAIFGGLTDQDAPLDLPFSFGFLPLFYQNGVWANDNVLGAAFAIPAKNSPLLKWANYDATFFWASDQINSDAFPGDNNAAEFAGTAWFIEAYDGYIEVDYAFVHDDTGNHRSYHNFSVGFTRRYFDRISNSIRLITNFDQALPQDQRTADGHLLLFENSLISHSPYTFLPYFNFFYGQGRTQSLARAAAAGGVLVNTGINFESDNLTSYPTLDATAVNTTGGAIGLNMLAADFSQQLILELAALSANGNAGFRNAPGDQYAVGVRYQKPLNNAWIFRTDHMFGWLRNAEDIRGSRVELRMKF
ncbi:MAG: hypothetical protein KDA45_13215, partial [Planctomycetales bacterium]|nr:hypothetical protein [Planctomycetales bacterium]